MPFTTLTTLGAFGLALSVSTAGPDTLSGAEAANLATLARAVGDVKYFYPNRHTARVRWERVLVAAVPAVRGVRTQAALARTLDSLLRPLAPALRFSPTVPPAPAPLPGPATLYGWEHHGLGRDKAGLLVAKGMLRLAGLPYASRLRAQPRPAGDSLLAASHRVYQARLADSVYLTLPVLLPFSQYQEGIRSPGLPRLRRLSAATLEQRVTSVMLVWNIIEHFYPHRGLLAQAQWTAALPGALRQAARARTEPELLLACRTLLAHLPDRHLAIGPKTRTGLRLVPPPWALELRLVEGRPVVQQAPAGVDGPAPGAVLTHVNGLPVGPLLDQLQAAVPATSPAVARALASGQLLTFLAAQAPAARFTFADTLGKAASFQWTFRQLRGSLRPVASPIRPLGAGVYYLDAARLRYADFQRALPQLRAARGLVVDLRQRPHYDLLRILPHFTHQALLSDSLTMPLLRQPAFRQASFRGAPRQVLLPQTPLLAMPKVFLVGPNTYSYGETIAELVRRHNLGPLLGQPTGGTNGELNFAAIGRAYLLSWTGRRIVTSPASYQGVGLSPDLLVSPTRTQLARQQDAELQRAQQWLREH